ncbi:MAG: VCBS repeat-containing protein [Chloroflexi bacterium]|nr:VCBS repeat-containing protein [Chloroflexota bacterium]
MKSALPLRMVLMAAIVLLLVGQPAAQAGVKGAPALAPAAGSDDFDSATVITSLPFTDTMDTTGATTAGDDPILPCGPRDPGENTVWWQFTASADGVLVADTEGSDYDTVLAVWTGTRGALTNVACDDDSGTGLLSRTAFWVTSGTTYYIEVADYGSGTDGVLIAAASDQARSLHAKAPQSIQAGGNLTLHVDFRALGHPISFGSCNVIGHVSGYVYSVAAADLDQDGRLDVVSGDGGGQVVAWQNDGSPFAGEWFSNTVGTLGDYVRTVAIGDLDGDGQPDVVSVTTIR